MNCVFTHVQLKEINSRGRQSPKIWEFEGNFCLVVFAFVSLLCVYTAVYVIHGCWLVPQVGNRYVCLRNRQKVVQESCGGYCDDVTIEERCGNPCCYRDCAMGAWAPWSDCRAACEQPGVKFRNRTVLQVGLLGRRFEPLPQPQGPCRFHCGSGWEFVDKATHTHARTHAHTDTLADTSLVYVGACFHSPQTFRKALTASVDSCAAVSYTHLTLPTMAVV